MVPRTNARPSPPLAWRALRCASTVALVVGAACGTEAAQGPVARPPLPARPSPERSAAAEQLLSGPEWYRHAVVYEVNVRSFQDSNGDGIGDLAGLTSRLDYLKELGVDALWLMPVFPTAFKDSGYDISDYRSIDPVYGDLAAFDALVAAAHARKMRVFVDLVLNHTSDQHAWFQESRANKTNPKSDWYLWSDTPGRADLGDCKPDNPRFGTGWSKDEVRGQYIYHRFYAGQPDLNYRNPEVVKETLDIARFWLERGTDGFRCDVIGKLFESPAGCDMIPETVEYIKQLRAVLDAAGTGGSGRAMVAEPSDLSDSTAYFGNGSDMFHMTFDFGFGYFWGLAFGARDKTIVDRAITRNIGYPKGSQPAQVLGSHDVPRAWQYTANEPWRHRNAALLEMTMRGTPFIYYGEEVGMRPGTQFVVDDRDASRTPMTWTAEPGHGFTTGSPWIAFGAAPEETAVEVEDKDPASTLTYYRQLLAFRRGHAVWGAGETRLVSLDVGAVAAFVREDAEESYLVAVNLTDEDQEGAAEGIGLSGDRRELVFGDGTLEASGGTVRVKIPAKGAAVFQVR